MLIILSFAGTISAVPSLSNSGGGSWLYSKDITINNPGAALTDYQVMVTLDSSNFQFSQVQANGEDIRFTEASGSELSYWIESWDSVGNSAKTWVKVPSIPSGTTTIRLYYGNPSAKSSSNGDATFEFFDDFNDNSFNSNNWVEGSFLNPDGYGGMALYNEAEGVLEIWSPSAFHTPHDWRSLRANYASDSSDSKVISFDMKTTFGQNVVPSMKNVAHTQNSAYQLWESEDNRWQKFVNGVESLNTLSIPVENDKWFSFVFRRISGTTINKEIVGIESKTDTHPEWNTIMYFEFLVETTPKVYIDNFIIRKYASSEPTLTLDAEQTKQTSTVMSTIIPIQTQTKIKTPNPTKIPQTSEPPDTSAPSKSDLNWVLIGGALFAVILIGAIILRSRKSKESTPKSTYQESTQLLIKRGYSVNPNNDIKFGIRLMNNTNFVITDADVILDYTKNLFSMKDSEIQHLGNITPDGKRTVTYLLKPRGCIHNEQINALITYKDHTGKKQTLHMRPKEVHCVCPFLKEKPMSEGEYSGLAASSESVQEGISFKGITVDDLAEFMGETCRHMLYKVREYDIEGKKVIYLSGESVGEKAYYLLTVVIQEYKGLTQVVLRAHSDKKYGLNGFMNEMADSLRHLVGSVQNAKEIGIIENTQVINIRDSVVQRSEIGKE